MLDRIRGGSRSLLYLHCGTSVAYWEELYRSFPGLMSYAERALVLEELEKLLSPRMEER